MFQGVDMKIEPIGWMQTCFTEKFGVPRQSGMVPAARGVIRLLPSFGADSVLHLSEFSHIWVLYEFHKIQSENHPASWTPTIQPPRIDAPRRVGVFASRSPHRPNAIGMSVVRLEGVRIADGGGIEIEVGGLDVLDGTPVIDIKPYVPYADSLKDANSGWIQNEIERYPVEFSEEAESTLAREGKLELARQILEWDPRPRSQREHVPVSSPASVGRRFAFRLGTLDLHWEVAANGRILVLRVENPLQNSQV
jgi:tRNA-Thr(GGU) m(6)t(6)A37 methyltransferase TsaA